MSIIYLIVGIITGLIVAILLIFTLAEWQRRQDLKRRREEIEAANQQLEVILYRIKDGKPGDCDDPRLTVFDKYMRTLSDEVD